MRAYLSPSYCVCLYVWLCLCFCGHEASTLSNTTTTTTNPETSSTNSTLSPLESNSKTTTIQTPTTTTNTNTIFSNQPSSLVANNNETTTTSVSEDSQLDKQETITTSRSPRSDRQNVLEMFNKFFTKARSHDDKRQKEFVRDGVINRLLELGYERSFLQKSRFEFRHEPAFSYNMISILPGKHRNTTDDRIVLVGAHWDSATKAPVSSHPSPSTNATSLYTLLLIGATRN